MRSVTRWAAGGSIASVAFAGGLLTAGAFSDAPEQVPVVDDPIRTVASRDSLVGSEDCGELLDWYVERNLRHVGPHGWELPRYYGFTEPGVMRPEAGATSDLSTQSEQLAPFAAGDSPEKARSNSETGTNTQEAGVDEPDRVKTDGTRIVRVVDGRRIEVVDVRGEKPVLLGTFRMPGDLTAQELLLVEDHALVTAGTPSLVRGYSSDVVPSERLSRDRVIMPHVPQATKVLDLDLSDPTDPTLVRTDTYTGDLVGLRQHGDTIRVITSTRRPELDWPQLEGHRPDAKGDATRRNRELLRRTTLEDWLPAVTSITPDGESQRRSVDCADVLHTKADSGDSTLTVFGYDARDPGRRSSTALTTDSQITYASDDRLYVATVRPDRDFWSSAYNRITGQDDFVANRALRTQLHAFTLDGTTATYAGSGHVDGTVRDRWSLDEHDGRLRVAYQTTPGRRGQENAVAIFEEQSGRLVRTGHVAGLGPDEDIKSVRWFDDFAVVVTFRQVDPLYTIDLADQDRPRALGELKIPGFSGYLHPIGGGLLLGLGEDGTEDGRLLGGQAAVFDITDLTDPRRISKLGLGHDEHFAALEDPRAFTWLPDARVGVTTVQDWRSRRPMVPTVLRVSPDGRLGAGRLGDLAEAAEAQRAVPLDDGRVAIVGRRIALVDVR